MSDNRGMALRWTAIILMALTAAFNLLGGIGTTCAAFLTGQFESFQSIMDYQWLYQGFVVVTIAIGLAGVWATLGLNQDRKDSFRQALVVLIVGTAVAAGHYYASLSLRGKAAPANVKLYLNVLTLLVFLILLIPGLRQKAGIEGQGGARSHGGPGAAAAILTGIAILTTSVWAAASHTIEGTNWVERLSTPLHMTGAVLILSGVLALLNRLTGRIFTRWIKSARSPSWFRAAR